MFSTSVRRSIWRTQAITHFLSACLAFAAAASDESSDVQGQLDAIARLVQMGDTAGALHRIQVFRAGHERTSCDTGSCAAPQRWKARVACDTDNCQRTSTALKEPDGRVACNGNDCRVDSPHHSSTTKTADCGTSDCAPSNAPCDSGNGGCVSDNARLALADHRQAISVRGLAHSAAEARTVNSAHSAHPNLTEIAAMVEAGDLDRAEAALIQGPR